MLFSFVLMAGVVSAQDVAAKKSCAKKCTASEKAACTKTCTADEIAACKKLGIKCTSKAVATAALAEVNQGETSASSVLSASVAADILADTDENISRKECSMSGKVSYFKKSECSKTGKVSMEEVKYCTKSEGFVNASPSEMAKEMDAKVIKTADTVDGKVQSASKSAKKKACCAGKKKCGSKKTGV